MAWHHRAGVTVVVVVVGSCVVAGQVVRVGDGEIFTGGTKDGRDPGAVVAHNLSTGDSRELYRPEQGVVFDFAASPSGRLVAVLQQIFEADVSLKMPPSS
jgi:hypothetical protein